MNCAGTSEKQNKTKILSAFVIFTVAMNVLALVFTVIRWETRYLSGVESYYANGFTLVFKGYPPVVEGCGSVLRALSVIHLILSVSLAIALGIRYLLKRSLDFGRFGVFAIISSSILSVLYMVIGIIAHSVASAFAERVDICSTATFWPFIFTAIITVLFFILKFKRTDEERGLLENFKK